MLPDVGEGPPPYHIISYHIISYQITSYHADGPCFPASILGTWAVCVLNRCSLAVVQSEVPDHGCYAQLWCHDDACRQSTRTLSGLYVWAMRLLGGVAFETLRCELAAWKERAAAWQACLFLSCTGPHSLNFPSCQVAPGWCDVHGILVGCTGAPPSSEPPRPRMMRQLD